VNGYKKYFLVVLSAIFSISVCAKSVVIVDEIKNNDGSAWMVEKNDKGYYVKYTNARGKEYGNSTIVSSDLEESNLLLDTASIGIVSLVMNYPRDAYIFNFSSGNIPHLISACKRITLPSADQQQVVALLILCSKDNVTRNMILSSADANKLFSSENLILNGSVKTLIGNDRAFLFDENKKNKKNNPYLIKGDVVEIIGYENSMLKVKYNSKTKSDVAWINFIDVL